MPIKVIMMLKNEVDLLSPWLQFHGNLVGFENLYIFDNGSTSEDIRTTLDDAVERGAHVDFSHSTAQDFLGKGDLFADLIQRLDIEDPAEFYFPLDCDEFLGTDLGESGVHFDMEALETALEPYKNFQGALAIKAGYDNNPQVSGEFFESVTQQKTFFARNACVSLDHGFHTGIGRVRGERIHTNVIYVHYHYKPFNLLQSHARQKLEHFTDDFSEDGLRRYGEERKPNYHVIGHLLADEASYYLGISGRKHVFLNRFVEEFHQLGLALPFTS